MNREDFPMMNTGYIYLDNGATTWKPQVVIDKINDYYTKFTVCPETPPCWPLSCRCSR